MCRTSCSQTRWATSPASASPSRCPRQMDQISGAYRSTSASHACWSPLGSQVQARVTRRPLHEAPAGSGGAAGLAVFITGSVVMIKGQDAGAAGEADLVHWFLLKSGPGPLLPAGAGRGRYRVFVRPISTPPPRRPARIGASPYPPPGYPRTSGSRPGHGGYACAGSRGEVNSGNELRG